MFRVEQISSAPKATVWCRLFGPVEHFPDDDITPLGQSRRGEVAVVIQMPSRSPPPPPPKPFAQRNARLPASGDFVGVPDAPPPLPTSLEDYNEGSEVAVSEIGDAPLPPASEIGEDPLPPASEIGDAPLPPASEIGDAPLPPASEIGDAPLPPASEIGDDVSDIIAAPMPSLSTNEGIGEAPLPSTINEAVPSAQSIMINLQGAADVKGDGEKKSIEKKGSTDKAAGLLPPAPPVVTSEIAVPEFQTWEEMVAYYQKSTSRKCKLESVGRHYSIVGRRASAMHPGRGPLLPPGLGMAESVMLDSKVESQFEPLTDHDSTLDVSMLGSRRGSFIRDDSSIGLQEAPSISAIDGTVEEHGAGVVPPHLERMGIVGTLMQMSQHSLNVNYEEKTPSANGPDAKRLESWSSYVNPDTNEHLLLTRHTGKFLFLGQYAGDEVQSVQVNHALERAVRGRLMGSRDDVVDTLNFSEEDFSVGENTANAGEGGGMDDESNDIKYFLNSMTKIESILARVQKKCGAVPGKLMQMVNRLVEQVHDIQDEAEDMSQEVELDDIKTLLSWKQLSWNFDNSHVRNYRLATVHKWKAILHDPWAQSNDEEKSIAESMYEKFATQIRYNQWHMPRYYSKMKLPAQKETITVKVVFGDGGRGRSGSLLKMTEGDTARDLVKKCLKKNHISSEQPDHYALKAVGFKDYMHGNDKLFNMEYIVERLRAGKTPHLQLVTVPKQRVRSKEEVESEKQLFLNYFEDGLLSTPDPDLQITLPRVNESWPKLAEVDGYPVEAMEIPFRVKIIGVENCKPKLLSIKQQQLLNGWMAELGIQENKASFRVCMYKDIPRLARIAFVLCEVTGESRKRSAVPLAYVVSQLMDRWGRFVQGKTELKMWPCEKKKKDSNPESTKFVYRTTNRENLASREACSITVQFDSFEKPIIANRAPVVKASMRNDNLGREVIRRNTTKQSEKEDLQRAHLELEASFDLLPQASAQVPTSYSAISFLYKWAPPYNAADALILLDVDFPEPAVREYALNTLRRLNDNELQLYLLQEAQCLKFEAIHDSPLTRFITKRALKEPVFIGHHFFWHLKAEMAFSPQFCERYACILEEYLSLCGSHLVELKKQHFAVLRLEGVSARIVQLQREEKNSSADCKGEMASRLRELNEHFFKAVGKIQLPLNPKVEVTTLIVEKCKYMSSKMVPLWLVFKNADPKGGNVYVIFKSGDDLRQDILTLQILRVMDRMWLAKGHDLKLNPYRVIATGVNAKNEGVGMIEVVMNSATTSGIQTKFGGGAMGAFNPKTLWNYLLENNKTNFEKAVDNFTRSCAGYCVATFVMGIGDRHNDNIMCTEDGHLFHIDFGHFLGNFKKKFGFNRERTAFVFTPEMAYVMTQEKNPKKQPYNKFLLLAKGAFNTCRDGASFLETLFLLMVPAGMPELLKASDISYLKQKLYLELGNSQAEKKLYEEINNCKNNTYRLIDNWIHNVRHGK
eukprot:jgi/Bigna1/90127/estExt_fgenesh1_pg.C_630024